MAKPWSQVQQSPAYQALSPMEKDKARKQYFEEVVIPKLSGDPSKINAAWQLFDQDSAIPNYMDGERERVAATGSLSPAGKASMQADVDKYRAEAERGRNAMEFLGGPVEGPLKIVGTGLGTALQGFKRGAQQVVAEGLANLSGDSTGLTSGDNAVHRAATARAAQLRDEEATARQDMANANAEIPGLQSAKTASDIILTAPVGAGMGAGLKTGVALGAGIGGLQPLTPDENRAAMTAGGAAIGAALTPVAKLVNIGAKGFSEKIAPAVKEIYDRTVTKGIQPSVSSLLESGPLRHTLEYVQNLPFAGGAKAINRQLGDFVAAIGNKFGVNKRELAESVMQKADAELKNTRLNLIGKHDVQYSQEAQDGLRRVLQKYDDRLADAADENVVRKNIALIDDAMLKNDGQISGEAYTTLRGRLQDNASALEDTRPGAAAAIKEIRDRLDQMAVDSIKPINPSIEQDMKALNRATSDFIVARHALQRTDNLPGLIDPKSAASVIKLDSLSNSGPTSTKAMKELVSDARKLRVGRRSDAERLHPDSGSVLRMAVKLGAAVGGAVPGQFLNSRAGAKFLAEGMKSKAGREFLSKLSKIVVPAGTATLSDLARENPPPNSGGGR